MQIKSVLKCQILSYGSKKGAWHVFRLRQFRNRMELILYSALHIWSESCSPTEQSRLLISIILVHAYSYCSEKGKGSAAEDFYYN